jgi:hypothetical protein
MQEENPMEEDRKNVAGIKARVQHGEYEVDPTAVADALLRHLRELATAQVQRSGSAGDAVTNRRFRAGARIRTGVRLRP